MTKDIRKRLWEDKNLGELARDISDVFGSLVSLKVVELDAIYSEPLYIGFGHEPSGIMCIRVRQVTALETPQLCGMATHFVWESRNGRARITSIDGLTPSGTLLRFTFLMVG